MCKIALGIHLLRFSLCLKRVLKGAINEWHKDLDKKVS